jgi:K+-sensing histidine kinase KdpD
VIGLLRARSGLRKPSLRTSSKRWLGAVPGYACGAAVVCTCAAFSLEGAPLLQVADLVVLFPLGVFLISARFGLGPSIFTAVAGVMVFDFLFIPPTRSLVVREGRHGVTLIAMLAVATGVSLVTDRLRRQARQARRQAEVERLRNALLSALSHDLRSPLTTLVGASTALQGETLDPRERRELATLVADEAFRLSRLVSNLLELTRLESGTVRVKPVPQAIDEVIGAAICRLERKLAGRPVQTSVPEEIPLALFDPVLIEQVLINLLENATKYTPPGTPIDVFARYEGDHIVVEVGDRGPGVGAGEEKRVFERLYRGARGAQGDGGIGLGLTICQAIVTAHEGKIWLENREGGGVIVRFSLPASPMKGLDESLIESLEVDTE